MLEVGGGLSLSKLPSQVSSFLDVSSAYIQRENEELKRIRKETWTYSYGVFLLPLLLNASKARSAKAISYWQVLHAGAFLMVPLSLEALEKSQYLPSWLPLDAIRLATSAYHIYSRGASTITTVTLDWAITKAVDEACLLASGTVEINESVKDEIKGLLLLVIDTQVPETAMMKWADGQVSTGFNEAGRWFGRGVYNFGSYVSSCFSSQVPSTKPAATSSPDVLTASAALEADPKEKHKPEAGIAALAEAKKQRIGAPSHQPKPTAWKTFRALGIQNIYDQWKCTWHAFKCSDYVYGQKPLDAGYHRLRHIKHTKLHARLDIYEHDEQNVIYLAFKGSKNLIRDWALADGWLLLTGKPGSTRHSMVDFIKQFQAEHPGKKIILTGHSLGGALASYYSAKTGIAAIVFDSPGLHTYLPAYDLSRVISFQSRPNLVNKGVAVFTGLLKKFAHYGAVYILPTHNTISYLQAFTLVKSHERTYIHDALAAFIESSRGKAEPERDCLRATLEEIGKQAAITSTTLPVVPRPPAVHPSHLPVVSLFHKLGQALFKKRQKGPQCLVLGK